jgi:hypothetical protein
MCHDGWQAEKKMHVIFHAADCKREQIMVSANGRGVCPQAWQQRARQEVLAVLCAEYKVNVVLCVAVGHVFCG